MKNEEDIMNKFDVKRKGQLRRGVRIYITDAMKSNEILNALAHNRMDCNKRERN